MTYTIGEVAKMLSKSISTLRYYDKEGLLPTVKRTDGNIRVFDEQDIEGLQVMECLKTTGMSLKDINQFFSGVWLAMIPSKSAMNCLSNNASIPKQKSWNWNRHFDASNISAHFTRLHLKEAPQIFRKSKTN